MRIMDVVTSTDVIVRVMKGMTHFIEGHAEYQVKNKKATHTPPTDWGRVCG